MQVHSTGTPRVPNTAEDTLSSGKAPTSTPPDHPVSPMDEFEKLADLYLVRHRTMGLLSGSIAWHGGQRAQHLLGACLSAVCMLWRRCRLRLSVDRGVWPGLHFLPCRVGFGPG